LAGHSLVLTSGNSLWLFEFTPEGPRKTLLKTIPGPVADLAVSPNGKLLAVTFAAAPATVTTSPYPQTGLTLINLSDKTETEFISPGTKSVRDPVWSSDSLYLAVWNNGQSLDLFDAATKTPRISIAADPGTQVGPPVFVPRQAKFSYVQAGVLYESDYSGKRTEVTSGVTAVRNVNSPRGPFQLANPHHYSPNTGFIAFHDSLGQLVLFTRKDGSRQILAEWAKDQAVSDKFSYGAPVFFDAQSNLVYYDLRKPSYEPGVDDHPLYIYNTAAKSSRLFFDNPKVPVNLVSLIPAPDQSRVLINLTGFQVFSSSAGQQANCDYTGFTYAYHSAGGGIYYTSPLKVWSPDNKFLFSLGTNQIAEVTTCAVSASFDAQNFDHAIWVK